MTLLQRLVYRLAQWAGLVPPMPAGLVDLARDVVREMQALYPRESNEYRRHMAFARLTLHGNDKRAAAIAIEIAVHNEF